MTNITFANPGYFWLLLALIPLIGFYIWREKKSVGAIRYSELKLLQSLPKQWSVQFRHVLPVLQVVGVVLLTVALARPQEGTTSKMVTTHGVDIMLVMDVSTSMKGLDFQPDNRLEVAKKEMQKFIEKREHDRIGLVLFAGRAFTKCPLTQDYTLLRKFIDEVDFDQMEEQNATAIGTAIATAANRLKESKAKSRMIVLLTDGSNNTGTIGPEIAAQAAAGLDIKVYTIGVGKKGEVPYPVQMRDFSGRIRTTTRMIESDLDEKTLEKIATITDATFFRAENSKALGKIYEMIDRLEKSEVETREWTTYEERFYPWLIAGFILLLLEFLLAHTRFRRIP